MHSGGGAEEAAFWAALSNIFDQPDVLAAAVGAIGGEKHLEFLSQMGVTASGFTRIFWGDGDYDLTPHKDDYSGFGQIIFYVTDRVDQPQLGTSIYRKLEPAEFDYGVQYRDTAGFEKITTYPFAPNTAFGFLNFGESYHGVELVPRLERRTVIHYSIHLTLK